MKEVKPSKRPILAYYVIIFLVIIFFNSLIMPAFRSNEVKTVDYSTFITMTEDKEIDKVQVEQDQILFTKKGERIPIRRRP